MNANSSRNITLYDPPRTADDDVELADIFEPFSISNEPLFQDIIPCCIHLGKFSYASCNLPNKSRAVDAFVCQYSNINIIIKYCIM